MGSMPIWIYACLVFRHQKYWGEKQTETEVGKAYLDTKRALGQKEIVDSTQLVHFQSHLNIMKRGCNKEFSDEKLRMNLIYTSSLLIILTNELVITVA
jgi:hypothetical protein